MDEEEQPTETTRHEAADNVFFIYAQEISKGKFHLKYCMEEMKFYLYKEGYWQPIHDLELIDLMNKVKRIHQFTISQKKQIVEHMKLICRARFSTFNQVNMLNFKNCMLNPYRIEEEPHDPIWRSTIQMPYEYDAQAQCPLWLKSLDEILEGHAGKLQMVQEFLGYCLIPDVKHKKAMLFIGDSDSGKSTVLNVFRAVIGKENCSSVPLKYLSNPQYTPMMVSKLCNIDPDVAKDAENYEGDFKIITSGEPVNCNQKFVKAFDFIPYARIILAANDFPKITDHSSAFYTRLLVIRCDRVFKEHEKDRLLFEKLKDELPGILNWALAGLKRLNERGMFEEAEFNKEAVEELSDENNPSNAFFKEHVQIKFGSEVRKDDLYAKYRAWCEARKAYALSDIHFGKALYNKYRKQTARDCRSSEGNRPRVWRNLEWVPFKGDDQVKGWEDE